MPEIVNKNADYSTSNFGNTKWVENLLLATGETDSVKKAALRTFFTAWEAAGFNESEDFDAAYLFFNTTAFPNGFNILDPRVTTDAHYASFVGPSGAHTLQGYQCSNVTTVANVNTNWKMRNMKHFHMHAYNTTAEGTGTIPRSFGGVNSLTGGNTATVTFGRKMASATQAGFRYGGFTGAYKEVKFTYDTTKTGLLTLKKNATVFTMYDAASVIGTSTFTADEATLAIADTSQVALNLVAGGYPAQTSYGTNCKLFFFGVGGGDEDTKEWTDAKETALNNMVNAFKTAIGA